MKGTKPLGLSAIVFLLLGLAACQTKQLYEQNTIYPDHQWSSKLTNEYQFTITDTNAAYKIYFVVRHHNAYHYKNIWVQLNIKSPKDSVSKLALNLNLADDEKGWLGTGMDDIFDQRIPINAAPFRLQKGLYKFSLQHTMREDPLENILSTGIRVEKVNP
jgi:gliding motility-associated lipoprotein GldH